MVSFHTNRYVLQVEDFKNWKYYRVITTREDLQNLIQALSEALEKPESSLRPDYRKPDDPTQLWKGWATVAFGKTDRVELSFEVAADLERYHQRKKLERDELWGYVFTVLFGVGVLGGVGVLLWAVWRFASLPESVVGWGSVAIVTALAIRLWIYLRSRS